MLLLCSDTQAVRWRIGLYGKSCFYYVAESRLNLFNSPGIIYLLELTSCVASWDSLGSYRILAEGHSKPSV